MLQAKRILILLKTFARKMSFLFKLLTHKYTFLNPIAMNKIIFCGMLLISCASLSAQEYSFPVQDQDAFLSNTSTFIESVTIGKLFPLIEDGKVRPGAGFRIGYSERDMVFQDDMIFESNNGELAFRVNDDPDVEYPDRLFRRGYTRLRGGYFRIGGSVGFLIGNLFQVSSGINADFRMTSSYKDKSYVNDSKVVQRLKGNDILQLNGQQYSWVVQAGFQGLSVCYEMSFNNFFKDEWGLDYQYSAFGLVYGF